MGYFGFSLLVEMPPPLAGMPAPTNAPTIAAMVSPLRIFSKPRITPEFLRILSIKNEISATKAEIEKIEDDIFVFPDPEERAALDALEARLKVLVSELEQFGDDEDDDY